jgi:hypothetical protein
MLATVELTSRIDQTLTVPHRLEAARRVAFRTRSAAEHLSAESSPIQVDG